MRLLVLRLHRFKHYRAKSAHDVLWTAAAIDALDGLLSVRQSRSIENERRTA